MLPAWPPPAPTPSQTSSPAVVQRGVGAAAVRAPAVVEATMSAPVTAASRINVLISSPLFRARARREITGHWSDATSRAYRPGGGRVTVRYLRRIHGVPRAAAVGCGEDR